VSARDPRRGRRLSVTARVARILAAASFAAACSSSGSGNTNYAQFYQLMRQSLSASFGKIRVTRDQAASISYATMGYSLDGGNQAMLILATDSGGELLWTSSAHVVIVTRDGRIIRTLGLGRDLSGLTTRNSANTPPLSAALQAPFTSTRLEDFPDLGLYGVQVSCRAHRLGRQNITILGQAVATVRVDETCQSNQPDWSFTDNFWLDADNGLVWRSRQHVHPQAGTVETEIFRPPG
jgi:hypothetical protein